MENEKLKQQLRDLCIAADGLATAMHLFYANVSSDILDHIIEEAEKENIRQRNIRSFDEYMSKHHTVETPCGPVRVVDTDKVSKEELGEMIHHCGQDAKEEAHVSLNELLGMKVICVGGSAMKCKDCSRNCGNCVKVELVGGDYLCLAEPQNDERPVISFDDESGSVMDDIKEKTEAFMDYLESIVKPNGNDEQV